MRRVSGSQCADRTGRYVGERESASHGEDRETDTPVDSSAEDESCHRGDRQRRKRLVPDIAAQISWSRLAIG